MPDDRTHDAGDAPGIDVGLQRVGHSVEACAREPDGFGRGGWEALSRSGPTRGHQSQRQEDSVASAGQGA
jgi:hypothetical protein